MKMKHPKVTGIIKAYKSLKPLWLPFFILQMQTHASAINCYSHRKYYIRPSLTITCVFKTHKNDYNCTTTPIMQLFIELVCIQWANSLPNGTYKATKKLSAPLNSLHPIHPLSNGEGTTGAAICNQSWPDQGQVSQNKSLHMFSIVLVPRAHERKERDFEVSIYWDSGASNHTRITFCSSLPLPQWEMWEERWGLVED